MESREIRSSCSKNLQLHRKTQAEEIHRGLNSQ